MIRGATPPAESQVLPREWASRASVEPEAVAATHAILWYFGATQLVFLHYMLAPWVAWPLTAACLSLWAMGGRFMRASSPGAPGRTWRSRDRLVLLLVAFGACVMGGEAHLLYANLDWINRDAVLSDLVSHSWPVVYGSAAGVGLLRAPLGMYLFPALAGKVLGLRLAHAVLLLQNSLLLWFVLLAITARIREAWRRLAVATGFLLFSGLDIVGHAVRIIAGDPAPIPSHLEWWANLFQYSSHVTQLFWVPHHALAGWVFVALLVSMPFSVWPFAFLALMPLWSPLAAIGAVPFAVLALARWARRAKVPAGWQAMLAFVLAGAPAAIYLSTGAAGVESGFFPLSLELLETYAAFVLIEVGLYLALLWSARRSLELAVATAMLLAIPFYYLNYTNDFAMRASIPSLAIVALLVSETIVMGGARKATRWALAGLWLVGTVTPAAELRAAFVLPAWEASTCNFLDACSRSPFRDAISSTYIVNASSFARWGALARTPRAPILLYHPDADCWREPPVRRSPVGR